MTGPALLRAALREHRGTVGVAAGLLGAHQALEALVPVVVGAALDDAIVSGDLTRLLGWLALLCLVFVALSNAYRIGARIAVAAQERVAHDLRLRIVDRVLHPAGGTADRTAGELLSLSTADADAAAGLVRAICFGIGVTVALLAGAAVLLVTSLRLGLLVLVGLPVLVWLGGRLSVTVARRADVEQERAADASAVATDLVAGIRVLAGIGGTRAGVARYRAASRSSLRATLASARAEAQLDAAAVLVSGVALAAVALVGGRLAAAGTISIGELVAAAGVTQFLVGPIARLAWTVGLVARARASGERIAAILATPHAIAPPAALVPAPQPADLHPAGLRLRELRTRGAGPLDGIDLDLAPGGLHGIVAAEAEAAALLSCLGRDRDPDAGEIVVGDIALHALDPADARRLVLVAPHDAALAGDTLGSIVGALAHDATAVTRALEAAAAQDIVAGLPAGLATPLAESGRSLSGGQRQRVALARVLAGDAPVLVLHDPTTALDPATEAAVARGLRTARAGRTTLVVTTSPALLAACDRVTVIRDGRVVAGGTHTDLHAIDVGYRAATTGAADPDPRPRAREVRG